MKILPTLSIQQGRVVSGSGQACADQPPEEVVDRLLSYGVQALGLFDRDAAFGQAHNRKTLIKLMDQAKIPIMVSGGIRSSDQIQLFLDHGSKWIVIGTLLHKSPFIVENLLARFRDHLSAGFVVRNGWVHRTGWSDNIEIRALDLAMKVESMGFKRLLVVDGPPQAKGPDMDLLGQLTQQTHLCICLGGNLSTRQHVHSAFEHSRVKCVQVDAIQLLQDSSMLDLLQPTIV